MMMLVKDRGQVHDAVCTTDSIMDAIISTLMVAELLLTVVCSTFCRRGKRLDVLRVVLVCVIHSFSATV
jgi:hypothetical protein